MMGMIRPNEITEIMDHHRVRGGMHRSAVLKASQEQVASIIAEALEQNRDAMQRVMEALLEPLVIPARQSVEQARLNVEARKEFVTEFKTLKSAEVGRLVNSNASNTASLANRWKKEGKVFAINWSGADRYPEFEFGSDGKPRPAISEVLAVLEVDGWQAALWFASPNGWLAGDARPVDLLEEYPDAVVKAADAHAKSLESF